MAAVPGERWIRATLGLAGAGAVGQAILVGASFVVVRLYSPAQVGAAAALVGAAGVLAGVSALRLDLAIVLADTERDAGEVLILCMWVVGGMAVLCGVAAAAVGGPLSTELRAPSGTAGLRFAVGPLVAVTGAALVFTRWAQRGRDYPALGQAQVAQCSAQAAGQLGLGAAGLGAWGLIGAVIAGFVGMIGRLGRGPLKALRGCRRPSRRRAVELVAQHRDLTTWSVLAFVTNGASLGLVPLVIAGIYGVRYAGFYAIAWRVLDVPSRTVGAAATSTFLGDGAVLSRQAPERFPRRVRSTVRVLAVVGALPVLACIVWGQGVFSLLFGHDWRTAGELAGPLSILALLQLISTPLFQTFTIVDRLRTQAGLALLRLGSTLVPLLVAGVLGASAQLAILAMVAGAGSSHAWTIVLSQRLSRRGASTEPASRGPRHATIAL